jgi:hypothetical protein
MVGSTVEQSGGAPDPVEDVNDEAPAVEDVNE